MVETVVVEIEAATVARHFLSSKFIQNRMPQASNYATIIIITLGFAIFHSQMNIADCYRLLGLKTEATLDEVKTSYRQLARQYHPDINPENPQAQEKFIQLHQAYKQLMETLPTAPKTPKKQPTQPQPQTQPPQTKVTTKTRSKETQFAQTAQLTDIEKQLKQKSYFQLQNHLKQRKFPRAIALIEGLAQRIPQDKEIKQWQAITYQRWARQLIQEKQLEKARIYLKKALKTDPHNRTLWSEVETDFRKLEQLFH